jgi:Spy/CpxP family protein refolding chaperone
MGRGLRSLALVLTFLCGSGWLAMAQSGRGGGYRHAGADRVAAHLRWLGAQLKLTENQKARLKPILIEESHKIRSVRQDASIPKDQKMESVQAIHDSFKPQINDVLTPEQREKYKQLEEKGRERWQRQKSGGSATAPRQQSHDNPDE